MVTVHAEKHACIQGECESVCCPQSSHQAGMQECDRKAGCVFREWLAAAETFNSPLAAYVTACTVAV